MKTITSEMILNWLEQCDGQLKLLQNAKDFIHREYYQNDSISYHVEEDLQNHFGNLIRENKTRKQMLEQMLIHCETENNVVMFDFLFEDRIVNRLPEYLQKEFFNQVYDM